MSTLDIEDKITVQFMIIQRHIHMINEPIKKVFADLIEKQGELPKYGDVLFDGGDGLGRLYSLCVQGDFDIERWCQDIQYKLFHLKKEIVDYKLFSIYYEVGYLFGTYELNPIAVYSPTTKEFLGYAADLADLQPVLK